MKTKAILSALLLMTAIVMGGLRPASAEPLDSKPIAQAQINRVHIRDGKLVKIPYSAATVTVRPASALPRDERIDEPEFVWHRASLTWIKNPRYGTAKALRVLEQ